MYINSINNNNNNNNNKKYNYVSMENVEIYQSILKMYFHIL